ncbi:hypothetical protein HUT19_41210 [Streptomyces sp. NA02950]|uniref:hypothetical protein n=1 Tax=Streptomyces sp. NA02950 TaxID=2742137 RepID=UPI0015924AC5|nr:hypothetical protein [Streptomyces sp. NA02950]QKV90366.1 hypothetical protein HUT19_00010 [Streptomyces sp. NA02950]QKV97301.1 hypothetical protein HUT19_41210 [Streptomyces sp. NA02950]
MDYANTFYRARMGEKALTAFGFLASEHPPTNEVLEAIAERVANEHAVQKGNKERKLPEEEEINPDATMATLIDVATDVLHHMDGVVHADALVSVAHRVFKVRTGEDKEYGGVALVAGPMSEVEHRETNDTVEFLVALCHVAVSFGCDPVQVLFDSMSSFEETVEAERFERAARDREKRLNG